MSLKVISPEVLLAEGPVSCLGRNDIERVKAMALASPKRRARICAHPDNDDTLHEMLIVTAKGAYFQPHKHLGKSESFHMIEGRLSVVFFDDEGAVSDTVHLGGSEDDRSFYYRLSAPLFHTVITETDLAVFHETTNGPFQPEDTVYAPWAPSEKDSEEITKGYLNKALAAPV